MATDPKDTLQQAIWQAWGEIAFTGPDGAALTVPLHDEVPDDAAFPYGVLESLHETGDEAQGYAGSDIEAMLVVWSRSPEFGGREANLISGEARRRLCPAPGAAPPFALAGHKLVNWSFTASQPIRDVDGVSRKVVMRLTYLTQPLA